MRMGYKGAGYQETFAAFIGKTATDNPMEYRKRSPVLPRRRTGDAAA